MGQGTSTTASSGFGGNSASGQNVNNLLNQYQVPLPDIAQSYLRSFNRGGPLDVPSYQEMYGSWSNLANRETGRQVAGLNEAFGSQGARYSSDVLGGQSRLRENLGQQLQVSSGNLLQNLRGQQFGEAQALGSLQYGAEEAGMARMFQDFLRRTSPPPLMGSGFGFNPPQPGTGIY